MHQVFFTSPYEKDAEKQQVSRADDHLISAGLGWVCIGPDNIPLRTASNEFEVRTEMPDMVQRLLSQHYGFRVSRVSEMDSAEEQA